jgi:hypothetical protein
LGADIVVAELDPANAERTASEVRGLGRRALVVPTDVTSRKDLRVMVEQTRFWRETLPFEQLAHQPQHRAGVTALLNQHVEDLALVINGTP